MRKPIIFSFILCALFGMLLSGCGIIGGAFTLPGEEAAGTPGGNGGTPTPGGGGGTTVVNTPLPLQTITLLPTGVPYLPAGCLDALSLTLDDYGKTVCVGGTVFSLASSHGTYYIYFSNARGKLYMMGTDWVDRIGLHAGECAYAEGTLSRDGVSPVMPITPYTSNAVRSRRRSRRRPVRRPFPPIASTPWTSPRTTSARRNV